MRINKLNNHQILRYLKKFLKNNSVKFDEIAKEFKENTTIAKDISFFALANKGNFKAIGEYTLQKLNLAEKDFEQ